MHPFAGYTGLARSGQNFAVNSETPVGGDRGVVPLSAGAYGLPAGTHQCAAVTAINTGTPRRSAPYSKPTDAIATSGRGFVHCIM